jgi:hypothetical protein
MATPRKSYVAAATGLSPQNTASSDHLKTSLTEPEPEKPTDNHAVNLINTEQQILTARHADDRSVHVMRAVYSLGMKIRACHH